MHTEFVSVTAALGYIHSLGKFPPKERTAANLERMRRLCELGGSPQRELRFVHVAGTNGKGSVCTMLSSILTHAGYRTGLYTSPFIYRFNERIKIDGADITDSELAELANWAREAAGRFEAEGWGPPLEFELITLMAFEHFRRAGCDVIVLETGLGGRLDPTNVIENPLLCVLTVIDLDHTQLLGDTVAQIAAEKCGIIKPNRPVVSYPLQAPEAVSVIAASCAGNGSPLLVPGAADAQSITLGADYNEFIYQGQTYRTSLLGRHQVYNAVTAVCAAECLRDICGLPVADGAIHEGLQTAYIPARFERMSRSPEIVFDGAHNKNGVLSLADTLKRLRAAEPDRRITLICGMMRDKRPETALPPILIPGQRS